MKNWTSLFYEIMSSGLLDALQLHSLIAPQKYTEE